MTVIQLPVPAPGEPNLETPLNENGEPFPFGMLYNANSLFAFADTATELTGVLIDGYMDIPEEDLTAQCTARILYAVRAQVRAQASIMFDADPTLATAEELAVLNGSRDTPPEITEWTCPIPLILVDMFYAPTTDLPAPTGVPRDGGAEARRLFESSDEEPVPNLIWMGAIDEFVFLDGLNRVGDITLLTFNPDDDLFVSEFEDFINGL